MLYKVTHCTGHILLYRPHQLCWGDWVHAITDMSSVMDWVLVMFVLLNIDLKHTTKWFL